MQETDQNIDQWIQSIFKNFEAPYVPLSEDRVRNATVFEVAKKIHWKFIPPIAAWWKRIITSIKGLLQNVFERARLDYKELSTFQTRLRIRIWNDNDDLLTGNIFYMK